MNMDDDGYNFFIDPPEDPLREEAALHAEAELEWAEEEAARGDGITWEQYGKLFDEAAEQQYQRLSTMRDEEIAAHTCECGHVINGDDRTGHNQWTCSKCGKVTGHADDYISDIPF